MQNGPNNAEKSIKKSYQEPNVTAHDSLSLGGAGDTIPMGRKEAVDKNVKEYKEGKDQRDEKLAPY